MTASRTPSVRIRRLIVAVALACLAPAAAHAADGPVILGGDTFPKNGQLDTVSGNLQTGWLVMQRELQWVAPRVGRFNDGSVAVLGAQSSAALADNAGAAIGYAAAKLGMPVAHLNGADAIAVYLEQVRRGEAVPRILWIPGTGSSNGLDPSEIAALNDGAATIGSFVAGGGGLIAHGDTGAYGTWLGAVAPGLEPYGPAGIGAALTAYGTSVLPGLAPGDVSQGAWVNAFRGTLGNLAPAVVATTEVEADGVTPRAIVLAGGTAWAGAQAPADLAVETDGPSNVDRGDVASYRIRVTNEGPNVAGNVRVTHQLPAGWTWGGAASGFADCVAGPPVTCELRHPLGVDRTATITVFGRALRAGAGTALTTARADAPEPTTFDNRAAVVTTTRLTRLRVRVNAPSHVRRGDTVTLRITVRNTGSRVAKRVVLRAPLPNEISLVRRPAGARVERGVPIWELGGIRPGRTRTVILRVSVDGPLRDATPCVPGHALASNVNVTSGHDCLTIRR